MIQVIINIDGPKPRRLLLLNPRLRREPVEDANRETDTKPIFMNMLQLPKGFHLAEMDCDDDSGIIPVIFNEETNTMEPAYQPSTSGARNTAVPQPPPFNDNDALREMAPVPQPPPFNNNAAMKKMAPVPQPPPFNNNNAMRAMAPVPQPQPFNNINTNIKTRTIAPVSQASDFKTRGATNTIFRLPQPPAYKSSDAKNAAIFRVPLPPVYKERGANIFPLPLPKTSGTTRTRVPVTQPPAYYTNGARSSMVRVHQPASCHASVTTNTMESVTQHSSGRPNIAIIRMPQNPAYSSNFTNANLPMAQPRAYNSCLPMAQPRAYNSCLPMAQPQGNNASVRTGMILPMHQSPAYNTSAPRKRTMPMPPPTALNTISPKRRMLLPNPSHSSYNSGFTPNTTVPLLQTPGYNTSVNFQRNDIANSMGYGIVKIEPDRHLTEQNFTQFGNG